MGEVLKYSSNRNIRKKKRHGIHPLLVVLIIIAIMSIYNIAKRGVDDNEVSNKKSVYNTIEIGLINNQTEIMVTTYDDAEKIYEEARKVLNTHPELFWATGGFSMIGIPKMVPPTYVLRVDSRCREEDIPNMVIALNNSIDSIVTTANKKCNSDYEKAAFVHDLLILNCAYDMDTYKNHLVNPDDGTSLSYTSYGCLVNRKAVCEGYSKAYKLILNKLNIECEVVSGTATSDMGSGDHAWNYIKLDDGYYFVDVTWDDPVNYDGSGANEIRRDYFCLNSEMMSKDHFPNDNEEVPYCDGKRYLNLS